VQVLELLLFYCLPRVDTNPIAHALLDQFGSLAQVMETPPEELKRVDGVGEATATFLALIHAFDRQYQKSKVKDNKILPTIDDCGEYLMSRFKNQRNETVYLLCLDAKCKVLCCKKIGEGSINSASVPIRRVVELALGNNAVSVVLAHNHPGGLAIPSAEDQLTTRRIAQALDAVEIRLADHIIVADDDFVSLVQSGVYRPGQGGFRR
jgi:DNA repair protein RadC